MKLVKISLSYLVFLMGFAPVTFSSEISSLHIVVLEDSSYIKKAPFASRLNVFDTSNLEEDEECKEHGVAVCSVLVGENSPLTQDTSITIVPSLNQISSYLNTIKPNDFVILNWSGATGYPGLSKDVLQGLDSISAHFNTILKMNSADFTKQVGDYIRAYDNILEALPQNDNPLAELLKYAKTCLLSEAEQPHRRADKTDTYLEEFYKKIESFKKYGEERAILRFEEMKGELLEILQQHDNTLIVRALGNDGESIDTDPSWQGLLGDPLILSHTILVHGLQIDGRKNHRDSNFTKAYSDHTLGKPYCTKVWNTQKRRYITDCGTSFSAPLATIDAFLTAKQMLDQTSKKNPSYDDVKITLLKK